MKHVILGLATASLAAGIAFAADSGPQKKPYADGDGVVTRVEMQQHADRMFARMDVNKDGKLNDADREARHAQMFDRMDTDKNGSISREEFNNAHPMRGPDGGMKDGDMGPGMHHGKGRGMGPDGMGPDGMGKHHRGSHGGMKMIKNMADTDKDGAISKTEFTAAVLQHFDQADANKDGKISKDERQAQHAKMREQWRGMKGGANPPPPPPAAPAK